MSELQVQPKQKRVRARSLSTQLTTALGDAEALQRHNATDEATISRMKLCQSRIATLLLLLNRKRADRLLKAQGELEAAKSEILALKLANEKLEQELAARPVTTTSYVTDVEHVLAQYEASRASKQGGAQ